MAATEIQRLESKIDSLVVSVQDLAVKLAALVASYGADKVAIEARLAKLEASPMRFIAGIAAAGGCLGGIAAFASFVFAVAVWLVTHG